MKIIIDTNIFFSAIITNGKVRNFFNLIQNKVINGEIEIILSDAILFEIKSKIYGEKIKKIMKENYDENNINIFYNLICNFSNITNPPTSLKINSCRDPEDNMILELASFEDVDYIISGDKDLLVLNPFKYRNKSFDIDCKIEIVEVNKFMELL
jgi:uncharacterized protein